MSPLTFPALTNHSALTHGFSLRNPQEVRSGHASHHVLEQYGLKTSSLVEAEQPHGNRVALVNRTHQGSTINKVDALITNTPEVLLVIRTADCGPIYFYDPEHHAVGLAHSGKKGTRLNIAAACIRMMQRTFSSIPEKLIAVLGPCIRPPHYEIDFAATIAQQICQAGIRNYSDCGINTASDLTRYYSYRKEKGVTGRHYAFIGIR